MLSTLRFYLLLIDDIVKCICKIFHIKDKLLITGQKLRKNIEDDTVYVCVHEWGGYPIIRNKTLKDGKTFTCGLKAQLMRYEKERKSRLVDLTVTMSDSNKCKDLDYIKKHSDNFIEVSNVGMDFSGYASFHKRIRGNLNSYVILSNSSVDISQDIFLDGYIKYMEDNPDVGILGISYSTKMYQTLIRRNFMPHIQSFFLFTTIDVLNEIVENNQGHFPGENVSNKRLLIREGEIGLSTLALNLGYNLAVVFPTTGKPFKFVNQLQWDKPLGDIRLKIDCPNRITPINE